jgi:hypothetical protein
MTSMTRNELTARKLLIQQWNNIQPQLQRLNMPAIRPADAEGLFKLITHSKVAGQIGFEITNVTFNVPERANGATDIYIVATGRIYLDETALNPPSTLKTVSFATEVGYFRKTRRGLEHVYGAHYDFALDEIGHPVFHAQLKSYNERGQEVSETFQLGCESTDCVGGVLRTVRLPTAQMDFFALIVQICADHLLSKDSGDEERRAFADLRKVSQDIQGAGYLAARLTNTAGCMRAPHWYP